MNIAKKLTIAALAVMMTAALCACGENSSTADSAGFAESSADAAGTEASDAFEIGSELTIGIAPTTASAGQKKVPVSVQVWNNTGFSACGIRLDFDAALTPLSNGNVSQISGAPETLIDRGEVMNNFLTSCLIGEAEHRIAFGAMSTETADSDGILFTCYFDVPEDAASGTEYRIACEMDSLNDASSQPVAYQTVDGVLRIE